MTPSSTRIEKLDQVGILASTMCAIHCVAMPFVITLLPFVGLSFLAHENTEKVLLLMSAALGLTSLCLGLRVHRSWRALTILSVGLVLLFCGRAMEEREIEWGVAAMFAGGIVVAASHWVNRALCRACHSCHGLHSLGVANENRARS